LLAGKTVTATGIETPLALTNPYGSRFQICLEEFGFGVQTFA
jgi:hypothetical protein